MEFDKLIQTGENFAQITFTYNGTPEAGMLAWIDSNEMKTWWRADNVIIEPYPSGMFYITWGEKDESMVHAIYGVVDVIDTEKHRIEISKIYYMAPAGKLGPIHLLIDFENAGSGQTKLFLKHTHSHKGQSLKLYNAFVYASWPVTVSLFKKYVEKGNL